MIIQFSCENYKSIKDKNTISFLASKSDNEHEDILRYINKYEISLNPVVSVYGANGAGKTNLLDSIGYMSFLVRNSEKTQLGDKIPFFPHKLSDKNTPSSFQIQFIIDEIRYAYGFSLNADEILSEYLYYFPNGRQAMIFERDVQEYNFGSSFRKILNEFYNSYETLQNRLFLSTAAQWVKIKEIKDVFIFLKENIIFNKKIDNTDWLDYTINMINQDDKFKKKMINLLNSIGAYVKDIDATIESRTIKVEELPEEMPNEFKLLLANSKASRPVVKLDYGNMIVDLNQESRGIKKIFELLGHMLNCLEEGKVFVYDELETSLHPLIAIEIIKLFMNKDTNNNNSQLLFSTHDANLLNLDLFRRDQIWFVEKNPTTLSSLTYSLANIKNVRKDENIEKGYIRGKYGSIPYIQGRLF